jgi:hypothetical protein
MDDKLHAAFANIAKNDCLVISSENFFDIYDSEQQRCVLLTENDSLTVIGQKFRVINPNRENIRFLAIDKCVFFDSDKIKRCDCLIYNDQCVCFIELKKLDNTRNKNSAKKTAREQLLATIKFVQEQIDFDNLSLEAYVCVGYKPSNPSILASDQAAMKKFIDLNTRLYNGCQKDFSKF